MIRFILLSLILLFTSCNEIGDNKPLLSNSKTKQPIIIVNKNRHLNIAEFWLNNIDNPNKLIMNSKEIEYFNNDTTYNKKIINDFKDIPKKYLSSFIKEKILKSYKGIQKRTSHFSDGNKISNDFYKEMKEEMNLNDFYKKNRTTRYALTVNYTNQKIIPTELSLLKNSTQIHFDRNQNSALDIATPLAILHSSKDGFWHYGIGPSSSGWVRDRDIAFGEREEIENYLESKNFVITTSAKNPLIVKGKYFDYLRMGVRLPFIMESKDMTMVMIPTRDENGKLIFSNASIKTSHIHKGYLPYTPKTILTQAFKFLNAPYGWGGMYGEQDCSKFLQEIYATIGVKLPRNSASQSNVGKEKVELSGISKNAKEEFVNNFSIIGGTIFHLKGHIVLYIGNYKGEPYIIHTVWGESSKHFALGRTAITSLNFNDYLKKIDKITNITID